MIALLQQQNKFLYGEFMKGNEHRGVVACLSPEHAGNAVRLDPQRITLQKSTPKQAEPPYSSATSVREMK